MSEEKHCSKCGKQVPGESPRGICPACLMEQAMASRTIVTGQPDAELPPPPSPEEIADKFPQYEVLECLGRGGMGVVYKARQKSLDRWVAIKVLAPERVHEERFAEHFEREAKTLAKMSHTNIVTVFDHGETGGLFYIVMEFVDGVNLRDLLREGKMEPEQALVIVPPICDALQYAHDKGIIHRDIKPENILLDRDGRVKIADFGIASLVGASGENSGTPPYMAPEQSGGTVDRRADIYALGVVLYEMLTGELPEKEIVAPSKRVEVSVKIDEMVLRALEKEPERRYQTAGEFRTMVETMAATPSEPKRDETRFAGEKRQEGRGRVLLAQIETWAARYGWLSVIAIGLGLLIILGAIANFNFTLGVGKAPMMMVGSIFVAGGIIGAAIGSGRNRSGEAADSAYGDQEDFRKQNKRPRPSAMSAGNPRFSRPAMVGACWASFAIIALFLANIKIGPSSSPGTGRVWWQWFLVFTVFPLGVTAPFGTTILGWISIARIRRSAGELHGLWLAVFDGLLFPLLVLAKLIGWFWHWVFYDLIRATLIAGEPELSSLEQIFVNNAMAFTVLATLVSSLVVGFIIIRMVWRGVTVGDSSARPTPRNSSTDRVIAIGCGVLALLGIVVVGLGVALPLILRNKRFLAENERQFAEVAARAEQTEAQLEKTFSEYDWGNLAKESRLVDGVVETVDGRTVLKIENLQDEPKLASLLTIFTPPIKARRYAIRGEIRYENVQGAAYLEMWNEFPRGRFFSRTLDEQGSGPMAQITGNSDWRPFILPFDQMRIANTPNRIEVNLHLPGRGVVFVGPLELVEFGMEQITEDMAHPQREELDENPKRQDAEVAKMAEAWLSGIDAGGYEKSRNEASEFFRNSITGKAWTEAVTKFREPLGELKSRKFRDSQNADALPGAPDGKYVIVQFDTSFAAKARAVETVTFMLEKDGSWKAAGYLIR